VDDEQQAKIGAPVRPKPVHAAPCLNERRGWEAEAVILQDAGRVAVHRGLSK
jgi:hypothetical protein